MNVRSIPEAERARLKIAIAATFTIEPIESFLSFWFDRLFVAHSIDFAPYNQVFQQLLDPNSLMQLNQIREAGSSLNVIFLRLEDWLHAFDLNETPPVLEAVGEPHLLETTPFVPQYEHDRMCTTSDRPGSIEEIEQVLRTNAKDFVDALTAAAGRSNSPYILCFCHPSPDASKHAGLRTAFDQTETYILDELETVQQVHTVSTKALLTVYPVEDYFDAHANQLGHVPYTEPFYTALAAATARAYNSLANPPFKVIVLDCDNTLWNGVCGEVGPHGVRLDPAYRALQSFMALQIQAGMLLCLCSKNVEEDVFAVFEQNEDMVLRQADLAAWRINWEPKSANLRSLAEELNLGIDSFVFIDDNPIECAEVSSACPEVVTLQLPREQDRIQAFLRHIWPLDPRTVTAEDRKRAEHYRLNARRERLRSSTKSLEDFLRTLDLRIDIREPEASDFARLSQLSQRTNQFNATSIRRTEAEIASILDADAYRGLTVRVSDRFGDYGLVGFALYATAGDILKIDSFMLSCRALGRGVEHGMMQHLGRIARERGLSLIEASYTRTSKNKPIFDFFERVSKSQKTSSGNSAIYTYDAAGLAEIDPFKSATPSTAVEKTHEADPGGEASAEALSRIDWQKIADTYANVHRVIAAIDEKARPRPELQNQFLPAHTSLEKEVVRIWQEVLKIGKIGLEDGFKELGGTSLHLVRIASLLHSRLDQHIPLTRLFALPTVRSIVEHIGSDGNNDPSSGFNAIQQRAARQKAAMTNRQDLRTRFK